MPSEQPRRLEIVTVPCLVDNYAYLVADPDRAAAVLVDVPEAAPIDAELARRGWRLETVILTHHHADHVQGLDALAGRAGAQVLGAARDAHRLPALDRGLVPGETLDLLGQPWQVLDAAGHTDGHIALYLPGSGAVFTADSLMALGCGRLFEGTARTMWATLSTLAALPPETLVYSGHDYAAANARFALDIDPDNAALRARAEAIAADAAAGRPAVPVPLALELATNPFLRAGLPAMKARLAMQGAGDAEVFAEIRRRKDRF